jgi:hypothetical protein
LTATAAEINKLDGATATTGDLNKLADITATAAEINKLDGATLDLAAVTATAAEVNVLDGAAATTDDLNKLSAVTATAAEINKLDGFTGDVDDLNYAEELRATGVTASEFDKLDGLTATTTELNYTDGVTSNIQTQLDAKYEAETQSEATWKEGASTTESLTSPAKVKAAVEERFSENRYDSGWVAGDFPATFTHGFGQVPEFYQLQAKCVSATGGFEVGDVIMLLPHADGDGSRRKSSHADDSTVVFSQTPTGGSPNNNLINYGGSNFEIRLIALKELR